ncbi:MAG: two-component system sensor histidine kinase PhoQ [Plesiomonas sp.]|uniref:two-component system sensor histidine kinase PhoQ n=2 Tax=Plesiomonas sp. TaxID=2486279 RepID=UPI003EE7E1B9
MVIFSRVTQGINRIKQAIGNLKFQSLRLRFLLATAVLIGVLSLLYGVVAIGGYIYVFEKSTYRIMSSEGNLFVNFAHWKEDKLSVHVPDSLLRNKMLLAWIYDADGKLLWRLENVPEFEKAIAPEWLKKPGFYEIDSPHPIATYPLMNNERLKAGLNEYIDESVTYSVAVNTYPASNELPSMTIVTLDVVPQELQNADYVWLLFEWVLLAHVLLIIPLLWLAANWSLLPIANLALQVEELENNQRQQLDFSPKPPQELRRLIINLNRLITAQKQMQERYRATLGDLTHSLKTPLAVLQTTLRSVRLSPEKNHFDEAEPVLQEQIDRISQQIGYYLRRADRPHDGPLNRKLTSVAGMLDALCGAFNKVYASKGISLSLDISPELIFSGDKDDFMEVMGNIIDNACKYSLEFVSIRANMQDNQLILIVDDDGPGIPANKQQMVVQRGQRADTLKPGQGLGLAIALGIVENYKGELHFDYGTLGGAQVTVIFGDQEE